MLRDELNWERSTILSILKRTPTTLHHMLSELPSEFTDRNYGNDTWSARQVVGHLIHGERTDWMVRIRHVLQWGDTKPFEPFDREGHLSFSAQRSLQELLQDFSDERTRNLATLSALKLEDEDFDRLGLHPALGKVTLRNLLTTWAVHDLNHIAQICKALAFQYQRSTGPWESYLSILAPPNPR